MTLWRDETSPRPTDFYKAGNSTAVASIDERNDERASESIAQENTNAATDQETAEGYKPYVVSLPDIVRLMAEYPTTIDAILDTLVDKTRTINDILNLTPTTFLDDLDFGSVISSVDGILDIINNFTSLDFQLTPILRSISDFANGIQFNASNILSVFTGFLPSNIQSMLSDVTNIAGIIQNIPSLINNFSPSNIAGWALNAIPFGGVIANFLGLDLSRSPLSFVANMIGGAGVKASGAGGFTQKSLSGGIEFSDGIRLSETHQIPKRKSQIDGKDNR